MTLHYLKNNAYKVLLLTATAVYTMTLLHACKKDIVQHYNQNNYNKQEDAISFVCNENNDLNTKAESETNKQVFLLSSSDSLYLISEEETMSTGISTTTKAAPTTTLNSTVGLFAYNHSSANIDASATQQADNHSINPMGGVLEEF